MSESECYYQILGINKNANENDIKRAYKSLAVKYHPDKNQDNIKSSEAKFKKINEAYSVLSDKEKRIKYDQFGINGLNNNFSSNDANDIFQTFFRGNNPFNIFVHNSNHSNMNSQFTFNRNYTYNFKQPINKYTIISNNTPVLIKNLINRSDLNNSNGTIIGYNNNNQRYYVELDDSNTLSLKRNNLQQLLNCKIYKLASREDLNNCQGTICDYNKLNNRYTIIINDENFSVKPDNIIINTNSNIELTNISNKPQFNGKYGKILNFLNDDEKYLIRISNNTVLKVKLNNVIA